MSDNNEKITLTLAQEEETKQEVEVKEKVEIDPQTVFNEEKLSEEEKKTVESFAEKIDINEASTILQYGSSSQQKVAEFSENALKNVKTKDLNEVGDAMSKLITELKGFKIEESHESGVVGWFKKTFNKAVSFKQRYDSAESNVEEIEKILEEHQIQLLRDIALLDQLYEKNQVNYKELSMYILAGQKALKRYRENDLVEARKKATETKSMEDAQKVHDLENSITRFEKKLHDLELTRVISIQMAPQIRLVQNNDVLMTEKIQSALVNTIPVWKSQMLIALGLSHSKEALKVENEVSEMTNKMLESNAKNLKTATIDVAKASERGIVDLETLQKTNNELIATLDEVARIQEEGRIKREEASNQLKVIESEVNQKLMDIKKSIKENASEQN